MPPTEPLLHVEVPPDVAREPAELADRRNVAIEDALARLAYFDYPADAVPKPGTATGSSGP